MIYVIGNWFTYGPRANVSTDKEKALEYFKEHASDGWELREAKDGSEFYDWETLESVG